jgi:hypothetical protein
MIRDEKINKKQTNKYSRFRSIEFQCLSSGVIPPVYSPGVGI